VKQLLIALAIVLAGSVGCSDKSEEKKGNTGESPQREFNKDAEEQIKQAFQRKKRQGDD